MRFSAFQPSDTLLYCSVLTATHAMASNATQEIKNISFRGRFGQLGETIEKTLEAHGFSTQTLSGNGLHVSGTSAHKGLETNSVVNGTANLRTVEDPRLNGVGTGNDIVLQFCWSMRCSHQSTPWRKGVEPVDTPAGGPGGGVGKPAVVGGPDGGIRGPGGGGTGAPW